MLALAAPSASCTTHAPGVSAQRSVTQAFAQQTGAAPTGSAPGVPPEPWILAQQLATLHQATERAPSHHFAGDVDGEILVNDAAATYPALGPYHPLAATATLVERHSPRGNETITAYFAMVKRAPGYDPSGGDWEYLVIAEDGQIEERGRLPLCKRCHVEAPYDFLFGGGR